MARAGRFCSRWYWTRPQNRFQFQTTFRAPYIEADLFQPFGDCSYLKPASSFRYFYVCLYMYFLQDAQLTQQRHHALSTSVTTTLERRSTTTNTTTGRQVTRTWTGTALSQVKDSPGACRRWVRPWRGPVTTRHRQATRSSIS